MKFINKKKHLTRNCCPLPLSRSKAAGQEFDRQRGPVYQEKAALAGPFSPAGSSVLAAMSMVHSIFFFPARTKVFVKTSHSASLQLYGENQNASLSCQIFVLEMINDVLPVFTAVYDCCSHRQSIGVMKILCTQPSVHTIQSCCRRTISLTRQKKTGGTAYPVMVWPWPRPDIRPGSGRRRGGDLCQEPRHVAVAPLQRADGGLDLCPQGCHVRQCRRRLGGLPVGLRHRPRAAGHPGGCAATGGTPACVGH